MGNELQVRDDLYLKISYGIAGSILTMLFAMGIWVGTHATRLSNAEARIERQKDWINDTNAKVDKKFETLDDRIYQIWTTVVPEQKRKELTKQD